MRHDVFVSFSFADQAIAEEICNQLNNRHGISCWICTHNVRASTNFPSQIVNAIKTAKCVVFLQSASSVDSEELVDEISFAYDEAKTIITFKLDDTKLNRVLLYYLGRVQCIDATTPPLKDRIDDLACAINKSLGGKSISTHPNNYLSNVESHSQKLSIFLSHSHKDIDRVRKLRDILEYLECEPLLFYLKCLDDNDAELQTFIKREIEARNIFLYCKSHNSESSSWVKKELDYIKSFDSNRLYTIDIDKNLTHGMIGLLQTIIDIVQGNQIFISYSHKDQLLFEKLDTYLSSRGYNVFNASGEFPDEVTLRSKLNEISKNGIFIPLVTSNYLKSAWCKMEWDYALHSKAHVVPVVVSNDEIVNDAELKHSLANTSWIRVSEELCGNDLDNILQTVKYANHLNAR